jgi:site-specific recombinase
MSSMQPSTGGVDAALAGFADTAGDPLAALARLFAWVRPRRGETADAAALRYEALLDRLEHEPATADRVRHHVARLLTEHDLVGFFANSGILPATGFFTELARIASERLLPPLTTARDLQHSVRVVFPRSADWRWFSALPSTLSQRFWRALAAGSPMDGQAGSPALNHIVDQAQEALLVLAYRLGGIDAATAFGRLGPEFAGHAPRFRGLAGATQRYVDQLRARSSDPSCSACDSAEVLVLIDQCQEVIERARRMSIRQGTSLRLTYLLRRSAQSLRRMVDLAAVLDAALNAPADADPQAIRDAVIDRWAGLVRQALAADTRRRSLRSHIESGVSMLALRVTDHAAKAGEHYIADTRSAYFQMWRAAMGAGLIIAVMALIKAFAAGAHLAPGIQTLAYSLIYGIGFVVIYMLHLTVATKQPAMTAQTIATYFGELREGALERSRDLERIVDLFVAVARTQTAAILGNVCVALPTAIALFHLLLAISGSAPISPGKAEHLLDDLDITGWALPHAALAGVFLFLSGVLTGYFDNKAVYAQLAPRIAQLRWLCRVAGAARARRLGDYLELHLGGLLGNFLFGCMLGSAGLVGILLGLPIDIRHIAFASANLGFALSAFGFDLPWAAVLWAALGVALIGVVNLAVSFLLALWMALRARGIALSATRGLGRLLLRRLAATPMAFFTPRGLPRDVTGSAG